MRSSKNFVRAIVPEPKQEAVAALAGMSEAGTITPVQMARPPHNFTPSQIAFHIIDRSFGEFRTLDYADLNSHLPGGPQIVPRPIPGLQRTSGQSVSQDVAAAVPHAP
jgi:hypothetical protein